jgi:GTPase SAR1 family protein
LVDIYFLCFDLTNYNSYLNITKKYLPILNENLEKKDSCLYCLVGTKSDGDIVVYNKNALQLSKKLNCFNYFAISSKQNLNLYDIVIQTAIGNLTILKLGFYFNVLQNKTKSEGFLSFKSKSLDDDEENLFKE